jgi:predicted nuclease of restriction endonuclease-like (RecB) superfamily
MGSKIIDEISSGLQQELPGLRGLSSSNIRKMRLFHQAWNQSKAICPTMSDKSEDEKQPFLPTLSDKLKNQTPSIWSANTSARDMMTDQIRNFLSISFSHHYEIILKTENETERWYYIEEAAIQFWTLRQLRVELTNESHVKSQKLPNNFSTTLPDVLSNKAIRAFKDQYLLDFVNTEDADEEIDERVLEKQIVLNIKKFLMALGSDFSFLGNQYRIMVDEDEYFIDLLFFHRGLQALIAFELKRGKFKPEYIGKMNFYLSALDDLVKKPHEQASIGIILCKEKDSKKVEYSFRDFNKPMGVATYKTSSTLPPELKHALPDAETLKKLME